MSRRFIVRTESHSLRKPVKLFFTVTPLDSKRSTPFSYPLVFGEPKVFDSYVADHHELTWGEGRHFGTHMVLDAVNSDRQTVRLDNRSPEIAPGECVTITSPLFASGFSWGGRTAHDPQLTFGQPATIATNKTGRPQRLYFGVQGAHGGAALASSIYDNVENGNHIIVPSDMVLQGYIVDASRELGQVPRPQDLVNPLLPIAINCNTLPASSSWILSQDRNGEVKLTNDGRVELGQHSMETIANSIGDMYGRLALVFKALDETQQRLATFEKSLCDNKEQLSETRKDLAAAHKKLSNMATPTLDSKAAGPEMSLPPTEVRIALVERSIATANNGLTSGKQGLETVRTQLLAMETSFDGLKNALVTVEGSLAATQHQVSTLDQKMPIFERKVMLPKVALSGLTIKDLQTLYIQLSGIEAAVDNNEKLFSAFDSSLTIQKSQLSDLTRRQISILQAKSTETKCTHSLDEFSAVQKSVGLAHGDVANLDRRVLALETGSHGPAGQKTSRTGSKVSATAIQKQVSTLDGRLQAVEAKAVGLEKSITETEKGPEFLQELERSVSQVRNDLSRVKSSLAFSSEQIVGLGKRLTATEEMANNLAGSLPEIRADESGLDHFPSLPGESCITLGPGDEESDSEFEE